MEKIRIALIGYGNVGRGVELAVKQNPDMVLEGIFTRRDPAELQSKFPGSKFFHISDAKKFTGIIDVAVLCGGSATDLPEQGAFFASMFNTVDSYDTHAKIPLHFNEVDEASRKSGKTSIISTGWDPGLFSLARVIGNAVLPGGKAYTFWGKGVSQGHSDAIRRIQGVKDGRQYTIPIDASVKRVRAGDNPKLSTREKHLRQCYVVAEEGANLQRIEHEIKSMPNYFADYDTRVEFISQEEMNKNHSEMPHGGHVLVSGRTGTHNQLMEFSLKLDSNPEFTGSVLAAYARAAYRLNKEGKTGAKTVLDVPASYLSINPPEELRKEFL
ncbi:diaminopimelate dehydrogenase [Candidatus Woesearchaeota archaeon]|nr:diaminopimelate dehydrogenase [Candidatus Woesearchaeota archaeon]